MSGLSTGRGRGRGILPAAVVVVLAVSVALAAGPAAVAGSASTAGPGAGTGAGALEASQSGTSQFETNQSGTDRLETHQSETDRLEATIDPALENASGNQSVLVEFADDAGESDRTDDASISTRQAAAEETQAPLEAYANATDGVDFEDGFWIANAATVAIDADRADQSAVAKELAELDGVTEIGLEDEISVQAATDKQSQTETDGADLASASGDSAPYNLEQTNVTDVWDGFHTKGGGTTVAVLDSGIDEKHPDIDLEAWKDFTTDPSDEPTVHDEHGTLVSGVATGANESGTPIGVAPDAALMHGAVVSDCDSGTCATSESAVLSGIEWAVEEDADAVSISLGWYRYGGSFVDAVETANDAGTVVVGAVGNEGEGSSLTPGNAYDALSVGAANESAGVAPFSSGEEIDTAEAWGPDAPDHWPETYTTPDIVAPGVGVESTIPDGEYRTASGTSIATPHVAGAVALVQSATEAELEPDEITAALAETAWKPDDACSLEAPSSSEQSGSPNGQNESSIDRDEKSDECDAGTDTRYGSGIIDAYAAIDAVGTHATLNGTVTDRETGEPVSNATVSLTADDGAEFEETTESDGTVEFTGLAGDQKYTIATEAEGYEDVTETNDVPADETTTMDSSLRGDGEAELALTDDHFGTGIDAATVELVGDHGTYAASHDENGTYTAANVPSLGEYELRANAEGYVNEERSVALETADDRIDEAVSLEGDATLEITAETDDGDSVDGAIVTVSRESGDSFEPATQTDEVGMLEVRVPGTGERYSINASEPDSGSGTADSEPVESQETETVTVVLSDGVLPTPGFGIVTTMIAVTAAVAALVTTMVRRRRAT